MIHAELFAHGVAAHGLAVSNPASGMVIATVRSWSAAEVEALVPVVDMAGRAWAARTAKDRAVILRRWFDLMLAHKDALAAICTAECGKPLAESAGEVVYAAGFIEWYAEDGKRIYGEITPTFAPDKRVLTLTQGIGTTAAITPWNFPIAMITRKVGPALAAGCPMILKPAEATPLCALALEYLALQAGLPENLFRVVPTNDPVGVGKLLCSHPVIRKLSFTGSTAVGKLLLEQCAGTVKRTSMELGGNAPFIVFDDADLDKAIDGIMVAKFRNAGQTCVCANRILVQDGIYDAFLARFVQRVAALRLGDGADPETQIGPLIDGRAVANVRSLIDGAVAEGASLATGGVSHPAGENFVAPTILTGVTPDMDIARSEIFGPVASVIRFATEAEAVAIANDTPYGLAAYIYASGMARIWRVMEQLEYGIIGVNEGVISTEVAPFGGMKESGLGREGSRHGIADYLELKYVLLGGIAA